MPHEIESRQHSINTSNYIVYDFEADTSTNIHEIKHAEGYMLRVDDCYE